VTCIRPSRFTAPASCFGAVDRPRQHTETGSAQWRTTACLSNGKDCDTRPSATGANRYVCGHDIAGTLVGCGMTTLAHVPAGPVARTGEGPGYRAAVPDPRTASAAGAGRGEHFHGSGGVALTTELPGQRLPTMRREQILALIASGTDAAAAAAPVFDEPQGVKDAADYPVAQL
jgi:hypothetical protein